MLSNAHYKAVLLFSSTLISFIVLVGALELYGNYRYYHWKKSYRDHGDWYNKLTIPSSNKKLMWEYRPCGKYDPPGCECTITTNKYGFRDYDYESPDKNEGVYRVAFVGDSVTLGYKVDYESTFVRRFQSYAEELDLTRTVQALNFGVDGYNTVQIFELLRTKVIRFSPDKSIDIMHLNDFDFEEASGNKIRYFRKPKSFFLRKVEQLYKHLSKTDYYLYYFEKNKHVVFENILEMRGILREKGMDFMVTILPVFDRCL